MRRVATAAALALAVALAGCGGDDDAGAPAAKRTPTATPEPPPSRTVAFEAPDGRRVTGEYTPAASPNAPAVVLVHEIRGGPDQWDGLVPLLHDAGFATLAYESRPVPLEAERAPDAVGALRWLGSRRDVDGDRVGMVGASIGASTTVYVMATRAGRHVDAAVALSPPDSPDIWKLQDDARYRPRNLLLVSDERESSSADGMLEGATRSRTLRSQGAGHGVELLAEPGVRDALLGWLDERVAATARR